MNSKKIVNSTVKDGNTRNETLLRYFCHQIPERCFVINGKVMPICSRCFGFYLGLLCGFLIPFLVWELYFIKINFLIIILLIGIIPMMLDGITQFYGFRKSNNNLRFLTGIIAGIVLGLIFNWLIIHIIILD